MKSSHAFVVLTMMLGLTPTPMVTNVCTCVQSPGNCLMIADADAVFEATVESIELVPRTVGRADSASAAAAASATFFGGDFRKVIVRAITPLRGEAQSTVFTAAQGASCGYEFHTGSRYLIVANRMGDGRLRVGRCGLTRPIEEAVGLLEYLDTLDRPSEPTRIWGRILVPARWVDFEREYEPIPAARVSFEGPEQRSVVAGGDGRYSVAGLPRGSYTVRVALPETLPNETAEVLGAIQTAEVLGPIEPAELELAAARACAEWDFIAPINSAISGLVTDAEGNPAGAAPGFGSRG